MIILVLFNFLIRDFSRDSRIITTNVISLLLMNDESKEMFVFLFERPSLAQVSKISNYLASKLLNLFFLLYLFLNSYFPLFLFLTLIASLYNFNKSLNLIHLRNPSFNNPS